MSCNGCRVLRKGCNRDCVLRPCLEWIKSPQSQANATLFLAKFYGRAGLMNLINAGPAHLYPEIFKSLLYEACGRIINPVEGALGLFSANNWSRCQAAVDAVLDGKPLIIDGTVKDRQAIVNPNHHFNDPNGVIPLRRHNGDIRHFSAAALAHRVRKNHPRFKKTAGTKNRALGSMSPADNHRDDQISKFTITGWELKEEEHHDDSDEKICFLIDDDEEEAVKRAPSHDSASVETVEPELVDRVENPFEPGRLGDVSLELTLGSF